MKVLHIEDRFHPNMGYQINYFAELHNPVISFYIITSKSFSIWKGIDSRHILNEDKIFEEKYNVKIYRLESSYNPEGKNWLWLKDLYSTIHKINPDIIFVHGLETLTAIRIIFSDLSKKYVIVSDTHTLLNQLNKNLRGKIFLIFVKYIYSRKINNKGLLIFCTTHENKLVLKNLYRIDNKNIKDSLIGTNLDDYKFDSTYKEKIRKELNISEKSKIILYIGKIDNKKKPHLILNAVKKIEMEINEKLYLIFIGTKDKNYFDNNFNIKFKNNIEIIIKSYMPNKELYKYYSFADFAIFPKENTLSSLDAQACKLPVIMEKDTTNEERLYKGGILYEKDNIDDLSKKILLLLNNNDLLKKLSIEGYEYIKNNYDYKMIVKKMEDDLFEKFQKRGT